MPVFRPYKLFKFSLEKARPDLGAALLLSIAFRSSITEMKIHDYAPRALYCCRELVIYFIRFNCCDERILLYVLLEEKTNITMLIIVHCIDRDI